MSQFIIIDPFPIKRIKEILLALNKTLPENYRLVAFIRNDVRSYLLEMLSEIRTPDNLERVVEFIDEDNPEELKKYDSDENFFYFSNIRSNLRQIQRVKGLKGTYLIELPFAVNNDYLGIMSVLKTIPNDIKFIDFYNMKCVRSIIGDFLRTDKFYGRLMVREHIEAINLQDLRTEVTTPYGMVFEVMQNFFVNNLINVTKENTDIGRDVCKNYVQKQERLKLLRNLRDIREPWFRCYVYHRIYDKHAKLVKRSPLRDTFTVCEMQIYNSRWFGVQIVFSAGRSFERNVDRTVIKFTQLAFKRIFSRYYYRDIWDNEYREIRYISLIFQDFPTPKVYLKIQFRRSIRRVTIMNEEDIWKVINEKRKGMNEFEYFFDGLFNNKNIFFVRIEEIEEMYRIFWFFFNKKYGYGVYAGHSTGPNLVYRWISDNFKD